MRWDSALHFLCSTICSVLWPDFLASSGQAGLYGLLQIVYGEGRQKEGEFQRVLLYDPENFDL